MSARLAVVGDLTQPVYARISSYRYILSHMAKSAKYERLIELYKIHGKLTADLVVEDAEDPDSPLHDAFEWDDENAAYNHRLTQARTLIARYKIMQEAPKGPVRVRALIYESSTGSYAPAEEVLADPERVEAHIETLHTRLMNLRGDLRKFEIFGDVVDAIDEIGNDNEPEGDVCQQQPLPRKSDLRRSSSSASSARPSRFPSWESPL